MTVDFSLSLSPSADCWRISVVSPKKAPSSHVSFAAILTSRPSGAGPSPPYALPRSSLESGRDTTAARSSHPAALTNIPSVAADGRTDTLSCPNLGSASVIQRKTEREKEGRKGVVRAKLRQSVSLAALFPREKVSLVRLRSPLRRHIHHHCRKRREERRGEERSGWTE